MFNIHRFREVGVTINVNTKGDNKLSNLSKLIESLDKQTNSVKSKMSNLKINIDTKQLEKTPDLLGRVEKGFRSLSLVRLTYLANGVRRVTSSLVDMVENAAGYEESLNLYRMALGQYVDEARVWSGELTDKLLIDETELMQSAGTFYNLARGLGVASDNAYTMSRALTQLTYDMSSYLNISVEAANTKIQSAMSGQARAIQGVGVAIQVASLQELAYSLGIKKSVSEMTQAEKTYLRYIQLMRSTTHMQGDLARTMITPANSIRILKTQIHLLGRAIGQVLTPIIMNAIPWIMAFTDALTRLATWLANKLGYKIADVDYSTAFIDGADAVEDYGDAVQKAGNKVKRSLAPFDELNVVTSTSGGSGGGLDDTILDDLKKYVNSYDMLAGYTDELKKKAQQLKKPAEKILKLLASVLGASVIGKAVVGIAKIIKSVGNFTKKVKDLKIIKTITDYFTKGAASIKLFMTSLSSGASLADSFLLAFGSVGTVIAGATFAISEFVIVGNSIGDALHGVKSWNQALGETVGVTAALAVAAGLLIGPAGAITVLAAGALAAGVEVGKFKAEEEQLAQNLEVRKVLYDGVGTSFKHITNAVIDSQKAMQDSASHLDDYKQRYEASRASVDETKQALEDLTTTIGNQNSAMRDTQWSEYISNYDQLKTAINDSKVNSIEYTEAILTSYSSMTAASQQSVAERIANIKMLESAEAGYEEDYLERERKIVEDYHNKRITLAEYRKAMSELKVEYGDTSGTIANADGVLQNFNNTIKDINFENMSPKELKKVLEEAGASATKTREILEQAKDDARKFFKEQRDDAQQTIDNLDSWVDKGHTLRKTQQEIYSNAKKQLEEYSLAETDAINNYDAAIKKSRSMMKDYLALVYADLVKNGADTSTEFEGVINTIVGSLDALSDVDLTESGKSTLTSYLSGISDSYTKGGFEKRFKGLLSRIGNDGVSAYISAVDEGIISFSDSVKKSGEQLGKNAVAGYKQGIDKSKKDATDAAGQMADDTIIIVKNKLDSHSPSRVFRKIGEDTVAGYVQGINNSIPDAKKAISSLAENVTTAMKNNKLSLNIDTNVEKSFNSILGKLQSFCNKWTSAVNTLVKNMKNTMNGITINADGKVSYTKMPTVTVSKFEDGGYPTSGELFFANENGRAEFITSIGNKTAVANQDQMVQALTNAIMAGFAMTAPRSESKQPINVNIGDRQVYNGVVDYQNRQSDRYGTTTTLNI